MRRIFMLAAVAGLAFANAGCLIPAYSSDPNERTHELINQSEDLRQCRSIWERIWFTDQPSHLTPDRTHGGIE